MAVETQNSPEFLQATDPRANGKMDPEVTPQKMKYARFTFTQSAAAGDIGSTMGLVQLPAGRVVVYPRASLIQWSAFGAARLLDVGFTGYTGEDGVAVSANPIAFDDDINVASAGIASLGAVLAAASGGTFTFKSQNGVKIQAVVAGGTIPAAATIRGYIAYAEVGQ